MSPREILSYIGTLIVAQSESPFISNASSATSQSMLILTLSRDRTFQICRSLSFPQLELDCEDILDIYNSLPDSKNPDIFQNSQFSNSKNPDYFQDFFSQFLLDEFPKQTLLELLSRLRALQIRPTNGQLNRLKHLRNYLRPPEIILWFALQLVILVVKEQWIQMYQYPEIEKVHVHDREDHADENNASCEKEKDKEDNGLEEFNVLLARSLLWAGAIPLSEILPEDVHFLVKKRKSNKEVVRRLCSQCSAKGAGRNKRSSFYCPRCEKCFCKSGRCFSEYHKQHDLRYYPYLTCNVC